MSSLLNKARDKIEQTLEKSQNKGDNPHSSNEGPHSSNIMNQADPRIDSDRDHRNDPTSRVGGYGQTQTHDQYGTAQGPGGITSSDTYGSRTTDPGYDNPRSTNAGPHSSNLMNKLDPRHDSDRDGRNDPTSRLGGVGHTQQYGDGYGQAGGPGGLGTSDTGYGSTTGTAPVGTGRYDEPTRHGHTGHTGVAETTGYGEAPAHHHTTHTGQHGAGGAGYDDPRSANAGPHSSNLMNKVDPRVDSDRDHRNDPTSRVGGYGDQSGSYGAPTSGYGEPTGHAHSGHTGGFGNQPGVGGGAYDDPRSANAGPHSSNLMNKVDPRVDSDRDHRNDPTSRVGGYGDQSGGYGAPTSGYGQSTGGHGGLAAAAGTTSGYGAEHGRTGGYDDSSYTPGSGEATKTAGPHDSNLLNKLDPRVDSDMDGSKTYGGNQTHR